MPYCLLDRPVARYFSIFCGAMETFAFNGSFQLGQWQVHPGRNMLTVPGRTVHLEPRVMQVLVYLAERAEETISRAELLATIWAGLHVNDEALTRAVSSLRKALGDDPRQPRYIATVPKRGYRCIATVHPLTPSPAGASPVPVRRWARWAIVAGILLVMALGAGFIGYHWPQPQPSSTGPMPRSLVALDGMAFDVALSPDGTQAAFVWEDQPDQFHLFVKDIATDEIRPLTEGPHQDFGPAWTANGQHLAFVRFTPAGCRLMTIPATGGPPQTVGTCGRNFLADPAWSPQEDALIYSDRAAADASFRLYQQPLAGTARQPLTTPPADALGDFDPAFSPDGAWLAFKRSRTFWQEDLYLLDRRDPAASPQRLTHLSRRIEGFTWDATGTALLFTPLFFDQTDLWRVDLEARTPRRLTTVGRSVTKPSVARTGDLAYEAWTMRYQPSQLDLQTGASQPIFSQTGHTTDRLPDLAPDGQRLVFLSNRTGPTALWLSEAPDQSPTRLTHFANARLETPRWAPDGNRLAFIALTDDRTTLYVMDAAGNLPRPVETPFAHLRLPTWTPQGDLVFAAQEQGRWNLWHRARADGAPRRLTDSGGYAALVTANHLYYVKHAQRGLWRRSFPDGPRETLVFDLPAFVPWYVHGAQVYYFDRSGERGAHLLRYDLGTEAQDTLATVAGMIPRSSAPLSFLPHKSMVYFTQIAEMSSELVLVPSFE